MTSALPSWKGAGGKCLGLCTRCQGSPLVGGVHKEGEAGRSTLHLKQEVGVCACVCVNQKQFITLEFMSYQNDIK